ncbi:MAG: ATP-binding protein, partial [Lentisphaeria bacterium]|nr:ATP-binding protein [Lentisphaeria bacterium]
LFVILAKSEKPVLLLLDEVPILVNQIVKGEDYQITAERRRVANEFMSWLRKNSLEHQGKVRIVISGSIGFEPVLHQAGLSATINNFTPFELKPWPEDIAVGCLRALGRENGLTYRDGAETQMVRLLGCCIPHHVQMFFTHAEEYCRRRGDMTLKAEDAVLVYQTEMLSTRGHAELTHYEDRLKLILGPERMPLALDLLTEAAVSGTLTRAAIRKLQKDYSFPDGATGEIQRDILQILEHDGYLMQSSDGYRFVSRLLCDWWKSRYQNFFTPVAERGE